MKYVSQRPAKLCKIQNAEGLFSTGGLEPRFTKQGKSWSIGYLKVHLRQVADYRRRYWMRLGLLPDREDAYYIPSDWRVVSFVQTEADELPTAASFIQEEKGE